MFYNSQLEPLKNSLQAAEDLRRISSMNIANTNTLGYKALEGVVAPDCECQCFDDLLPQVAERMKQLGYYPNGNMHVEMVKSNKPGKKVKVNGQAYEGSNVDPSREVSNLVTAASMTRSTLAAIQLENKLQLEALNTLRGA
jgi:flagellar basal body rod protein FlgG